MIEKQITTLVIAFTLFSATCVSAADYKLDRTIDYEKVLEQYDFRFDEAPKDYSNSLFIGNGMLGSTIWARPGEAIHFSLGRNDVYNTRQQRGSRLLIGNLSFKLQSPVVSQPIHLSLHKAEAEGEIITKKGRVEWRSIIPHSSDVCLIEYTTSGDEKLEIQFDALPPMTPGQLSTFIKENFPAENYPKGMKKPDEYGNPLFKEVLKDIPASYMIEPQKGLEGNIQWVRQFCKDGQGYALVYGTKEISINKHLFAYSIQSLANQDEKHDKTFKGVKDALNKGYEPIADTHYKWWDAYYNRTYVSVPDSKIERFYWIQIYKIASATRPDGVVLDEMGPWVRPTMWDRVWWNLNIQLAYNTMISCNRLDYCQPFINILNNSIDSWKASAAEHSDVPGGMNVGRTTDIYGNTAGSAKEFSNFTFAVYYYWLYCRYTGDTKQLVEKVFPLMKGAATYMMDMLEKDANGIYNLREDISPEYKGGPYRNTNYNLGPLVWNLNALLYLNRTNNLKDKYATKWQDVLDNIVPYPTDDVGLLLGENSPITESHRHYSHLLPFYPFRTIDMDTQEGYDLCKSSFDHWVKISQPGGKSWNCFSWFGAAPMAAWLNDGDAAAEFLRGGIDKAKPNTFFTNAVAIESVIIETIGVNEILLQSKTTKPEEYILKVFPAMPSDWKNAAFDHLMAEGAFEVSGKWKNGTIEFIEIASKAGNPCNVVAPFNKTPKAIGNRSFTIKETKTKKGQTIYAIDLQKGEKVLLVNSDDVSKSYRIAE